jgi:hypothetical protein
MNERERNFLALFIDPTADIATHTYYPSFEQVSKFMEGKWSEMWEDYLGKQHEFTYMELQCDDPRPFPLTQGLADILNLSNLVTFLLQKEQVVRWGWIEKYCDHCRKGLVQMHWTHSCERCGALGGKIESPAYQYAREAGMVKE